MKIIRSSLYLFTILFTSFASLAQDQTVVNDLTPKQYTGSILINKNDYKLYLKLSSCTEINIYKLGFDPAGAEGKARLTDFGKFLIETLNSRNTYAKVISANASLKNGLYYVSRAGYPYTITANGSFVETSDGYFKIDTSGSLKIFYKSNLDKEEKLIYDNKPVANVITDQLRSNFSTFSYDNTNGKVSLSFKSDNGYDIRVYDIEKSLLHPDILVYNNPYNWIYFNQLYSIVELDEVELEDYKIKINSKLDKLNKEKNDPANAQFVKYTNAEIKELELSLRSAEEDKMMFIVNKITKISKKGDFGKVKNDARELTETFMEDSYMKFLLNGGLTPYNDSLLYINNLNDYVHTGFKADDKEFVLTDESKDPQSRYADFMKLSSGISELTDLCPNMPNTVLAIEKLNQDMDELERSVTLANLSQKQFQFLSEEKTDANGLAYTEVKVLRNCAPYDLNDAKIRAVLKEFSKKQTDAFLRAIKDAAALVNRVKNLNSEINQCKQESSGAGAGLDKFLNTVSKGGLKVTMVLYAARGTKILESANASKSELDNLNKVLDSYEKTK